MSEMTKLVIDGWPLVLVGEAKEPRILDVDLAERLGYERPRAIRDLIERLVRDQILNDFDICRTARQSSERKERKAGRPPTEYSDVIRALEQLQKRLEEKTDPNQPLPFGDRAA